MFLVDALELMPAWVPFEDRSSDYREPPERTPCLLLLSATEICGKPASHVHGPYCLGHVKRFEHEYKVCRCKGCYRWAKRNYPFSCARHGGHDYLCGSPRPTLLALLALQPLYQALHPMLNSVDNSF